MSDWWDRWQLSVYASLICFLCINLAFAVEGNAVWVWTGTAIIWAFNALGEIGLAIMRR